MKVALVHDWLTGMRGGEKCLEVFCELFPEADLFTLLHQPGSVSPQIEARRICTSFLQRLPRITRNYRYFLPLMPRAIESLDLRAYDLVLSSSHCVAKGVRSGGAPHISYCHTPMRYVWDQYEHYFGPGQASPAARAAMALARSWLQRWDVRSSRGVEHFIANSEHVQKRIQRYYDREATVIVPPVDTDFYKPRGLSGEDFFLIVSAFVPYKRLDVAIQAFNRLALPLRIVGGGPGLATLKRMAGPTIEFFGWAPAEELREHYERCQALIYPGEEDFGIIPVEAQAMGRPVIALARGGALETVRPHPHSFATFPLQPASVPSGLFFDRPHPESLMEAVQRFRSCARDFDPQEIHRQAQVFGRDRFVRQIRQFLRERASVALPEV